MISLVSNSLYYPLCLGAGYSLCHATTQVNRIAVEKLGFTSIDFHNGGKYEEYVNSVLSNTLECYSNSGIPQEKVLGIEIYRTCLLGPFLEEVFFRFIFHKYLIPYCLPQCHNLVHTSISSAAFSLMHASNSFSEKEVRWQVVHTVFLGVVCAVAMDKLDIFASTLVHVGFNIYAIQYLANMTISEMRTHLEKLDAKDYLNTDLVTGSAYMICNTPAVLGLLLLLTVCKVADISYTLINKVRSN